MIFKYDSPLGTLKLDVIRTGICTLRFPTTDPARIAHAESVSGYLHQMEMNFCAGPDDITEHVAKTRKWLDLYFSGKKPDFMPDITLLGSDFQKKVWRLLQEIPYGESISYGVLARRYQERYQVKAMSAQAIGQAVGANQLPIIIPCHRVLGSNNKITGFADGVDKKAYLLGIEQIPWRP